MTSSLSEHAHGCKFIWAGSFCLLPLVDENFASSFYFKVRKIRPLCLNYLMISKKYLSSKTFVFSAFVSRVDILIIKRASV